MHLFKVKILQFVSMAVLILSIESGGSEDRLEGSTYMEKNHEEFWSVFEAICKQYYSKLKNVDSDLLVFVEVSTARGGIWPSGEPFIQVPMELIEDLNSPGVSFYLDEEFEAVIPSIKGKHKIVRVTFFPNAISSGNVDGTLKIPIKDGDVMKWRHRYLLVQKKNAHWKFVGVE